MPPTRPPSITTIVRLLEAAYGPRPWRTWGRPLDVLIGTILSQNTNDRNSDEAMRRLRKTLPDWNRAADAPLWKIAGAIRVAGLHRQKAANIRTILRGIRAERGRLGLDFLRRRPTHQVREYLGRMPGVGPKTVGCVLLFGLRRPVLPVDTHIHRVSLRLGLIPPKTSAEKAHELLAAEVPDDLVHAFHVLMIEHGRRVCHARRPQHAACALRRVCPSAD